MRGGGGRGAGGDCKQPFLKGIAIFIGISESTVALGEESGEGRREPPRGGSKQAKLKKSGVTRSVLNIFFFFQLISRNFISLSKPCTRCFYL